jgi:glycosyltransferase involved in cell wall biosynthesis
MKRKELKKLVFISPFQFRLHRGIERFTYSLANALARKGFSITVYTWTGNNKNVDWGKWHPTIKIRRVPYLKYFESFTASLFYRIWLKIDNPAYIFLNFLYHGEHRLSANQKYIYILHSPAAQIGNRYVYINGLLKRFPNLEFVAVSQRVKKEAIPYIDGRKITMIYNGVDTDLFKPAVKYVAKKRKTIQIISATALEESKGVQHLVRAISSMDENLREKVRYDIFGDGPFKNELQKLITGYNLDKIVSLKPPVNNLYEILPEYDLFCLLSRGDAFGIAVLEAMACGIPILASNSEPFSEFVDEEFGACIDPEDTDAITKFIENCKIQNQKNNWSAASRKKSMLFNWEHVAENYMNLLATT